MAKKERTPEQKEVARLRRIKRKEAKRALENEQLNLFGSKPPLLNTPTSISSKTKRRVAEKSSSRGTTGIKPPQIYPMLAKDESQVNPFDRRGVILQQKFDGTRIIAIKDGNKVNLMGRSWKNDFAERFPKVVDEIQKLPYNNLIIDGELTFFKGGKSEFLTALAKPETKRSYSNSLMLFDILQRENQDLTTHPLSQRLKLLASSIPSNNRYLKVIPTYTQPQKFPQIFDKIIESGGEGVVLKNINSPYIQDSRAHWFKVKKINTADCIICGVTQGTGKRLNQFGALILGQYDNKGKLVQVAKASGFDDDTLALLHKKISAMEGVNNYFNKEIKGAKKFIKPSLVIEVKYMEKTSKGGLRHPNFVRMRPDKLPQQCKINP